MAHIDVTKENFEQEVIRCEKPVLLDFWAVWCGPCKMIAPVLEQIADAYADRLVVGKVNVDEQMPLAMEHKITSIPALMVYRDGGVVASTIGYHSYEELESWLKEEGIL